MRGRFCFSLFASLVHVSGGKAAWRGVASVCGWVDGLRMDGGLSSSLLRFLFTFVQMLFILQPPIPSPHLTSPQNAWEEKGLTLLNK